MTAGALVAALALVAHAYLISPIVWAALRAISGFALSSLYVGAESWIHDRAENANRGRVFSIYMVVQMIALTLAQFLLAAGNPAGASPFLLAGLLFALSCVPVVSARASAPHRAPPEPFGIEKLFFVSPLGAIATLLAGVSWSIVFTFGPVYAQRSGFSLSQVSIFMALAMFGGALSQFPFGWLSDAVGRRRTIALMSAGGVAVSLFGIWANGENVIAKFAAALLVGALVFPVYAISAAHTNDAVEPQNRVSAAAGLVLLFGFGSIFGPLASGGAVSALGTNGYYVVLAVATLVSLAAAAVTR
jgi:MFS family permease